MQCGIGKNPRLVGESRKGNRSLRILGLSRLENGNAKRGSGGDILLSWRWLLLYSGGRMRTGQLLNAVPKGKSEVLRYRKEFVQTPWPYYVRYSKQATILK